MSRPSKDIKAEYITITELAKLVSKSPQSIYKKMRQKPSFNQYVRVFDGKKYVHRSAVWEEFGIVVEGCEPEKIKGLENPQPESPLVSVLTDQLKEQKQQIEGMQRTIDSLTAALQAEQTLHAVTQARLQETTARLEALTDQQAGTPDGEPEPKDGSRTPDQGQAIEPEQQTQELDSTPFDEEPEQDQSEAEQKPLTFLDRIMKILGLK